MQITLTIDGVDGGGIEMLDRIVVVVRECDCDDDVVDLGYALRFLDAEFVDFSVSDCDDKSSSDE